MNHHTPRIDGTACIAPNATIIGNVEIGADCSIFFNATLRGDCGRIVVGRGSNVQENSCLHVSHEYDTIVGENCTIGHGAIVHGCIIGSGTIVGMGAIVIDGAKVGRNCLIGAGALVTGSANIPDGMLVIGSPAKAVRPLTEAEIAKCDASAAEYVEVARSLVGDGFMTKGFIC